MPRPSKKSAPVHVVRRWESSPIIYGWDSRERRENPDFHPAVSLTSTGKFVNDAGRELALTEVPDYIKKEAKATNLDITYRPPGRRELSMRDAMLGAGVEDTEPDPKARTRAAREAFA